IKRIHEAYAAKSDEAHFARLVANTDIADNAYNLSVSSYVEQEDKREAIDIDALNAQIKEIVTREERLRAAIDKIIEDLA
ncbi:MAG: N-6 DNA methylase, partial [Bacteroidales bacterium]|nr:N-6 DNA methylase [Bacteroidales bacterium]